MKYYLFNKTLGREKSFGRALIRSYVSEGRYVSGSVVFLFCSPQTHTHIPKVS